MSDDDKSNSANLGEQLGKPVDSNNVSLKLEQTVVGPFFAFETSANNKERETNAEKPTVRRERLDVNTIEDLPRDLAYQNGDNIVMREFNLSDEMKEKLASIHNHAGAEYVKGNPAAELSTLQHELAHYNREHNGSAHIDYANGETNFALNYVDEKSARVVETLSLVNVYNHCKEQNMAYFTYKDTTIKVDELLDVYPNLKETVEKHGSDLNNPETVTAIAKTVCEDWDKRARPIYEDKEFAEAAKESHASISAQIQGVKDGEKAMAEQLKNLDIGYGMKIDLPDECKEFIYPSKEYLHDYMMNSDVMDKGAHPSSEGLLAIDKHLEEKGITSAEDKDKYLKAQYEKIVNRAPDADLELKNLMLAAEMNPDRAKTIAYTDGLIEKRQGDKVLVSGDNGKTYSELTDKDRALLAQEISAQKGKYPPDAASVNDDVIRTMSNRRMTIRVDKANAEQQEKTSNETTKTTVNVALISMAKEASR